MDPVENVIAGLIPTTLGAAMGGAHFLVWFTWILTRLEEVYETHSGYCFYGTWAEKIGLTNSYKCAYHDYHHTENQGNFGGPEYLDVICGTQDGWLAQGGIEGYIAQKHKSE
jgi:hypothetical protein